MSSQAVFARLASAMKKAVKRRADESDSDDSIDMVTNRGNKLRKKARYVREGKLAPPSGPEVYKRTITHAGYERDIISHKPILYDEDGFELDSDDDDEGAKAAFAAAAEFYPYSEVKIENLLAPLTKPGDLPDHPTLSRPFTSKPLTDLTRQAREMVQKEKDALWKMKQLLTLMSGDRNWAPCEIMETEDDIQLFSDRRDGYREHHVVKDRVKQNNVVTPDNASLEEKAVAAASAALEDVPEREALMIVIEQPVPETPAMEDDVVMIEASNDVPAEDVPEVVPPEPTEATADYIPTEAKDPIASIESEAKETTNTDEAEKLAEEPTEAEKPEAEVPEVNADMEPEASAPEIDAEETIKPPPEETQLTNAENEEPPPDIEEPPEPRRMRTRAQAQAASDNTITPLARSRSPSTSSTFIHPYFLPPLSAHPDPTLGLPPHEAEEARRLLQLYIQKQEEVCRGAQKLYEGLLKADRLRKTVLKWAKADAHLGEMSDGEDWYDQEEWGLTEELKKGQDEEEEDAATTAKKTRTRRQ